jgi:hypothetical protein
MRHAFFKTAEVVGFVAAGTAVNALIISASIRAEQKFEAEVRKTNPRAWIIWKDGVIGGAPYRWPEVIPPDEERADVRARMA